MSSRRVLAVLLTGAALAACGSDSARTTESEPGGSSVVSTALPAVTQPSQVVATEPATPTTEPAPESAASEVGALVPEVLCVTSGLDGFDEANVFFAVDNQSSTPVVVADPAANLLAGVGSPGDNVDNPLVPTVFGLGRTSPAFSAVSRSDSVSWSLTGPDGVTRTATATIDSPVCSDDVLKSSIGDDREYLLNVAIESSEGTPPTEVSVTATPVDVTTLTSRCGAGLEALPTETWYLVNTELQSIDEPLQLQMEPPLVPGVRATLVASAYVDYVVVDRCAFDGVESRQWPMGPNYTEFGYSDLSPEVCVTYDGTELRLDDFTPCPGLPLTGGSRVRPSTLQQ